MATHAVKAKADQTKKKTVPAGRVIVVSKNNIIDVIHTWNAYKKIDVIKAGISKKQFEEIKQQTELDYDTLAKILSVTKATLHNKKGAEKFSSVVSERILLLADIYTYGYEVFGDKERFNHWINRPVRSLGGETPISIMDTIYGMEEVKNIIGRIAYGVYS